MRYVELSHTLEDGMVTFPGDPPVNIGIYMSREEMRKNVEQRQHYWIRLR